MGCNEALNGWKGADVSHCGEAGRLEGFRGVIMRAGGWRKRRKVVWRTGFAGYNIVETLNNGYELARKTCLLTFESRLPVRALKMLRNKPGREAAALCTRTRTAVPCGRVLNRKVREVEDGLGGRRPLLGFHHFSC